MRLLLWRTTATARASLSTLSTSGSAPSATVPPAATAPPTAKPRWVQSMPTRAIAHVLMQRESRMASHDDLYREVLQMGMVKSHRHFKHCLKMMKLQKRVNVLCLGLLRVGSAKRKFAVKLTNRGNAVYRFYKSCEDWTEQNEKQKAEEGGADGEAQRGLKDAF